MVVRLSRYRLLSLICGVFAALTLTTPAPATPTQVGAVQPDAAAACTGTSGVTVVVDYGPLGGGVQVECALGDPATGLAALQGAGFAVTGTQRWGLAFVCRINGQPTAATEPCVNTPPASAYWSYWHASGTGAAWTYSTLGASSYDPAPGTVEGWSFGAGAPPGITAP